MSIFFVSFCTFASLSLITSILVILAKNPVFSALFLVLAFCNVSAILLLLGLEFLPIMFLVVYVGAIAVLFLFVIMMLNITQSELRRDATYLIACLAVLFFIFTLELFLPIYSWFAPPSYAISNPILLLDFAGVCTSFMEPLSVASLSNISSIGSILFSEYAPQFITVGYVLFLAMVGSITLTLHKSFTSKTQHVYAQVSRKFHSSIKLS